MAERIVSPGVFTRERDLSFLPQAIGEIGAAIVGPTAKGPAFVPTQITSFQEYEEIFGTVDDRFYTPYTVQQYLRSAGVVTVVRVLGLGGYRVDQIRIGVGSQIAGAMHIPTASLAILAPSQGNTSTDFNGSTIAADGTWDAFTLTVSGSGIGGTEEYALSFNTSSANFVTEVISGNPQSSKSGNTDSSVYVYKVFKHACHVTSSYRNAAAAAGAGFAPANIKVDSDGLDFYSGATGIDDLGNATSWTGNQAYNTARTPYINAQSPSHTNLFRIYTRSHGDDINKSYKIGILNIKPAADIAGSDFGTFSIQVRVHSPGNLDDDNIVEQFDALTFDKTSPDYFAKRIGDRFVTIDSNGKLTYYGNYPNLSKHIRVGDYKFSGGNQALDAASPGAVPFGHSALYNPVEGDSDIPASIFNTTQTNTQGTFDQSIFYGFDLLNDSVKDDNHQYLAPIPNGASTSNNVTMSLEAMSGNDDASTLGSTYADSTTLITPTNSAIGQRKFIVPFQWGFDGRNPATPYLTGVDITAANTQGFDLSSSTSSGSLAYKRALNSIGNPEEFDINLLVTPGVIHRLHSSVTNHAISKVEARADALYIMDSATYNDSVQTVNNTIKSLDTNYVATYYPWVKIPNLNTAEPVWVPPSVVLPGVISYTDQVAHEWFAPAGLNRGGLTSVLEAKTRLTHAERDELYEGRVNPIASFPGQGVVVFGQKTLQSKPSALDRINVRRLLIALRKFIASASRYLVFEQNTQALRNRFLNIVNPYLEQVQQNSGLSAFRVVMDDTNNTPDVVDRNQLVGQIFVQPTRTAEFIVLDFVVQPTGATFPE